MSALSRGRRRVRPSLKDLETNVFTGIVRTTGRISRAAQRGAALRLQIVADGLPWAEFAPGDSIAVNGVCLTAARLHADGFEADVSAETLRVTTLGGLTAGAPVNLEPALALGERLGGHLVSGHVDGTGRVRSRTAQGEAVKFEFEVPQALSRYLARKGSVAIDGVSLTINHVSGDAFGVTIIPHTLDETIIGDYAVGTPVNIEVDMMARYLERLLGADTGDGMTTEFLKAHGYG